MLNAAAESLAQHTVMVTFSTQSRLLAQTGDSKWLGVRHPIHCETKFVFEDNEDVVFEDRGSVQPATRHHSSARVSTDFRGPMQC